MFLALFVLHSASAQATSTATENGIISAAGSPASTQSVSYTIEGLPAATVLSTTTLPLPTSSFSLSGQSSNTPGSEQHGLAAPAVLGITIAVVLAVLAIVLAIILVHKRRSQSVARGMRKCIMDMEFAGESKANLHRTEVGMTANTTANTTIGYFDIAKPLPAVVPEIESDRLSRSSTIIGDAAEVAQINRKMSSHQRKQKEARDAVRARNLALQILITNEDNRTSVLPSSPLTSSPTTPVDAACYPPGSCPDGNGDPFAKRPSKI